MVACNETTLPFGGTDLLFNWFGFDHKQENCCSINIGKAAEFYRIGSETSPLVSVLCLQWTTRATTFIWKRQSAIFC